MAIPKIRAGNDFTHVWAIERGGVSEDLTGATDVKLYYRVGNHCNNYTEKTDFVVIDTNKIQSEHLYYITGTYNLKLTYIKDGKNNVVDVDAFKIVPESEEASEATDFAVTSDMAIGFKGDPFTYDDFTPEQIAELQQPATDAIASIQEVELAVETAEGLRVQAELNRQTDTSTAIFNANNAASLANEKAGLANDAALLANEKAGLAATATTQANAASDNANSAAQSATNLVNSYATDLAAKELKANKQNSLAVDGTGTKFPTVDAVNEGLGVKANVVQEAWITPTLLNGWQTYAESPFMYRKDTMGRVWFKGRLNPATKTNLIFMNLPVGYRPSFNVYFNFGSSTYIVISNSGSAQNYFTTWISLDGLSFSTT